MYSLIVLVRSLFQSLRDFYHLSSREESTTETEDRAMAAEPIQGCSTRPMGMNKPGGRHGPPVSQAGNATALTAVIQPIQRYMVNGLHLYSALLTGGHYSTQSHTAVASTMQGDSHLISNQSG